MIRLDQVNGGFLITHIDSGRDILIQMYWDYPGLASSFGWRACTCGATDGTKMITSAYNFLVANDGECVEDPGYFD